MVKKRARSPPRLSQTSDSDVLSQSPQLVVETCVGERCSLRFTPTEHFVWNVWCRCGVPSHQPAPPRPHRRAASAARGATCAARAASAAHQGAQIPRHGGAGTNPLQTGHGWGGVGQRVAADTDRSGRRNRRLYSQLIPFPCFSSEILHHTYEKHPLSASDPTARRGRC